MEWAFQGQYGPEVTRDVNRLYLHRKPLFPVFYALGALAMLGLVVYRGPALNWMDRAFYLSAALVLALLSYPRCYLLWRLWWPRFNREVVGQALGVVDPEGIRWGPEGHHLPWSVFIGAKADRHSLLLYLTPSEPLPLHRSFFQDDLDWASLVQAVRSQVRNTVVL